MDALSDEFQLAMRRKYYPSVDSLAPLSVLGHEVVQLAVKPTFLPDTNGGSGEVVYVSPATGYVTIYRKHLDGGRARSIVAGGQNADMESFHAFDSRMDASRNGLLLFAARYGDRDAVMIWDLERGKVVGRYQFPELVSMLSPQWMPDGQSIVVSGLSESGVSDLYRIHLPEGRLEQLTSDRYQDLDPTPSADGRRVVFASDRTEAGLEGAINLFSPGPRSWADHPAHLGHVARRGSQLGHGRPGLLHLGSGWGPQRFLRGFARRGPTRDLRLERCVRRGTVAGRIGTSGRRLSRSELEPLPVPDR